MKTIGLLAGVALGGTHSWDEVCIENELEGSEASSGGMSLRSDCNSLLSEESSSAIAAGEVGDHGLAAWYGLDTALGELLDKAGVGLETVGAGWGNPKSAWEGVERVGDPLVFASSFLSSFFFPNMVSISSIHAQ